MNKYIFCLAAAALSLGAFTACEDVPAPYGINNSGNNNGGNTGETKTIFAANFDTSADGFTFQNVTLGDGLTYVWKQDVYNGKGYLKASAYANSQSNPSEAWAVSPAINLSDCTEATLNFRQAVNKIEPGVPAEMYSVWASTDYAGDVTTATWTQLNVPSFPEGNSWTFSDAGAIDLAAYCGKENVRIAYKYTSTSEASGTWEVDEFTITGNGTPMNNGGSDTPSDPGVAAGDGSQANPYNALGATAYVKTLAADVNSEQDVYIKGKVAQVDEAYGTQYGSGSFLISEDGSTTNTFKVWRALYLGNKKYTEGQTALKVGDEVIVCGKVVNYKGNTPETAQGQAYLYSLNGVTEGGETPDTPDQPSEPSGTNLIANGGFETWTDGKCDDWKSTTSASNATVSQSTTAHSGQYAILVAGNESSNKRLGSKEYKLNPGTYTISMYVKGAGQVKLGYAIVGDDGKIAGGDSYKYGDYVTTTDEWTLVTYEFTLDAATTVNFVVMNPKTSKYATASDKLIDDFSVVTANGGIAASAIHRVRK